MILHTYLSLVRVLIPPYLISISQPGVLKLLQKLNPLEAIDSGNIPSLLLGTVAEEITPALILFFNKCLATPVRPQQPCGMPMSTLYTRRVIEMLQQTNHLIFLTSICGKMLEPVDRSSVSSYFHKPYIELHSM